MSYCVCSQSEIKFNNINHLYGFHCALAAYYAFIKGSISPAELCWSVPGVVKKIHHRSLPFSRSWPPLWQRSIRLATADGPS